MSIPQSGGGPIESFEQLAAYMEAGCKPASDWRIGTEHEKFGYVAATLEPLPYEGACSVRAILEGLRDGYGWTPVLEKDAIIGLTRDGANVSLEPGGQLELSGAPVETVHDTKAELESHLREVAQVADGMGAKFLGVGAAPVWTHEQMPVMPKGRYRLMTDYMGQVGTHGTQMMYRTCTVQVNLDYASEADMVQKLRVALALQPVATALFASSPFFEGRVNGHKSWRSRIWRSLDAARTGMLPFVFEDGMGFQRYVDWVLDVPMYFVYRDGSYINALGQSFRDFLKGELPALPGEKPTLSDWADHMTTVFPEARVKKYIEMRGADAGPLAHLVALPALWVGLTYDGTALDAAWDLAKGWSAETREALRVAASVDGLQAEVDGLRMADLAREVVAIAQAGLLARGRAGAGMSDEAGHLDVLAESAASGRGIADDLLDRFHGQWEGDLRRIYPEMSY
ncbi:glutamate--cysteine ligase [Cereibacter sphaeroides]|uniref:glutamate--cysteine ligase n=1 Tax=Cereibacter sphaeroides TaxID=1063 RepID=UPI001F21057B|nr:glutamate--cysteine ligase [Cereibacter sphaeroides]MCE6968895.1 glutamate--cysteine ligase [Cereibacter sphaeroides]